MTNSQNIKTALAFKGMSESELARALGSTPQGIYKASFEFPDGTNI